MNRIPLFLLFILALTFEIHAQVIPTITGNVLDEETNAPITRAHILLKAKEGDAIIAFTQSLADGRFTMKNVNVETSYIELSHIGYATKKIELGEKKFPITVKLSPSVVKIKEVVIVPSKIRAQGDTIVYNVASFAVEQDRSIADVLKRMPGIKIEKSGEITYQGEKLNKFYIEGSDMLGGRYNLATNNISHQDVAAVEVMENHQPIKALEELVISTQPALNIRLKEKAKSRWAGNIKGEGGIPSLWSVEALAMRFKKRTQTLNTYKGSNTGKGHSDFNLFSSIGDFEFMRISEPAAYININPSTAGSIEQNRYRFSRKNNLSSNNLLKLNNDFQLVTEVILSHDDQTYENASRINIFLNEDSVIREEKKDKTDLLTKQLEGKLQLKGNKKKYYLKNEFTFKLNLKETNAHTLGTYPNAQYADNDNKRLSNDLNMLWRFGRKVINFRSYNEYVKNPQYLIVTKENGETIRQDIDLSSFISNTLADYSFALSRKFRFSTEGKVSFENRNMTNKLNQDREQSDLQKYRVSLNSTITYNDGGTVTAALRLPLYYQYIKFDADSEKYYGIDPSLYLTWTLSSRWTLSPSLSAGKRLPQADLFYNGYIQNNYRVKSLGYINFEAGKYYGGALNIRYKDVLGLLFANASLSFSRYTDNKMANQYFHDDYIINSYLPYHTKKQIFRANSNASKWLNLIKGTASLTFNYQITKSDIMRNSVAIPYKSTSLFLSTRIDSKIKEWSNLTYSASLSNNKLSMSGVKKTNYSQFRESLDVVFILPLQLKFSLEHYCNEISDDKFKNFLFTDVSASYLLGEKWELFFTAKNIFNNRYYSYVIDTNQTSTYQEYKLRGFNLLVGATYQF